MIRTFGSVEESSGKKTYGNKAQAAEQNGQNQFFDAYIFRNSRVIFRDNRLFFFI